MGDAVLSAEPEALPVVSESVAQPAASAAVAIIASMVMRMGIPRGSIIVPATIAPCDGDAH